MIRSTLFTVAATVLLALPHASQETAELTTKELEAHVSGWSKAQFEAEFDRYQAAITAEKLQITEKTAELKALIDSGADAAAEIELTAAIEALSSGKDALRETSRKLYEPAAAAGVDLDDYKTFATEDAGLDINIEDVSPGVIAALLEKWYVQGTTWIEEEGSGFALKWVAKLGLFFIVLIVFRWAGRFLGKLLGKALSGSKVQVSDLLKTFSIGMVQKLVLVLGLVIGLGTLGINVAPLLTGLGIVGFVLGFALQDTLSNFAAGIMILFYRPYDVGDYIAAGGQTGTVDSMSLVSTTIVTPDNQVHVVPNGAIWGGVITNITKRDTRRVDLVVGVAYDADLNHTLRVLTEVVTAHASVFEDPEPMIKVSNLGDSSVDFVVRPWCRTVDYWDVKFDLTKAIKERLDEERIGIPFPQRDIHLIPAGSGGAEVLTPAPAVAKALAGPVESEEVTSESEG